MRIPLNAITVWFEELHNPEFPEHPGVVLCVKQNKLYNEFTFKDKNNAKIEKTLNCVLISRLYSLPLHQRPVRSGPQPTALTSADVEDLLKDLDL